MGAMIKRRFGAIPSPVDKRDYLFRNIAGALLPVVPYHSSYKDKILDQLWTLMCGPFAIVAARAEQEFRQTGRDRQLSYTYVYGSDYDLDDERMYMRTLMKIAVDGIPYLTNWEHLGTKEECRELVKKHMTDELIAEKQKLRGSSYYACKTWQEVCNSVRVSHCVLLLVGIYDNWNDVGEDGIIGADKGKFYGYHFIRVKDYEILDGGELKIRCQNSWGEKWGDNGYCYLLSNVNSFVEASCLIDNVNEVVNKLLFPDVDESRWSAAAIEECAKRGILTGFEDGTFRPNEPVTREQLASFAYRMIKLMDGGGNDDG